MVSRTQEIEVNGTRLVLHTDGTRGDPPILLLHALGECAGSCAPVSGLFAASFQVLALDLRGHGDSDRTAAYSFDAMCDDVIGLVSQLRLGPLTLVGHSMGGVVAYLVAMRQPDLVRRLVIEDVSPPYKRDRPTPEAPENPDTLSFDWEVVPAIVGEVNAGSPRIWAGLKSIKARTLLIGGGPDSHVPQDRLLDVADRIPRCDVVTIASGHHVHSSQPEAFAEAVLSWLKI